MEINLQSLALLRERLQHEADMGRLSIIASMAAVEEWKLRAWLENSECVPMISELRSIFEVMEHTHTIVLESAESLQLEHHHESERFDPYNYYGKGFR